MASLVSTTNFQHANFFEAHGDNTIDFAMEYLNIPYYNRKHYQDIYFEGKWREADTIEEYIAREREQDREVRALRVEEEIYDLVNSFFSKYGIRPNTVYVSQEDYYKLISCPNNRLLQYRSDTPLFMGMEIIPFLLNTTHVALIEKN